MMFLVIVANIYIGAQFNNTAVCWYNTIEYLKDSGFSCSVITDKGNPFSFFNLKGNIIKKSVAVKCLG